MDGDCKEKKENNIFSISPELTESSRVLTKTKRFTEKDGDQPDTLCGFGSWTPEWIQKAANPKLFLFFFSMAGLLQGAQFTYLIGCLSTLEKRYSYDTKRTGILMIADEFAPVLFGALVGYFGGLCHRPRLLTFGMLVGSLSCFVMAIPYFIYGPLKFQHPITSILGINSQFCDEDYNIIKDSCATSITLPALSILSFGNFIHGVSCVMFYSIGTSYLDDSVNKNNSPIYLGIFFAARILGPAAGFLLSSLTLQFYEDPFFDPGFGPNDPRWIGAWWLGFIALGILILIFSAPMILFPKKFPTEVISKYFQQEESSSKPLLEQMKDMGKAMVRLVKNPILVCHFLGGVLRLNGMMGYYVLLPKYMEMQFKQSASKASLYSGPASIIGMQIGILLGAVAIRRYRPRPRELTGAIVFVELFAVAALIICMLMTCPLKKMPGTNIFSNSQFHLENECNVDCMCTTEVYTPICGPDGVSSYFSPCYAGCSRFNKTEGKELYTDCKCVHNEDGEFITSSVSEGYCNFECQWLLAYVVILTFGKLISSTARVGNCLISLRCVDPEDKSITLGTSSGVFSLLAFIPYPLIYGALTDATCLVWQESCGESGNCWIYDTDKFRYLLHGVSAAFISLGCLTDICVWYFSPRIRNLYEDECNEDIVLIKEGLSNCDGNFESDCKNLINGDILNPGLNSAKEKRTTAN